MAEYTRREFLRGAAGMFAAAAVPTSVAALLPAYDPPSVSFRLYDDEGRTWNELTRPYPWDMREPVVIEYASDRAAMVAGLEVRHNNATYDCADDIVPGLGDLLREEFPPTWKRRPFRNRVLILPDDKLTVKWSIMAPEGFGG